MKGEWNENGRRMEREWKEMEVKQQENGKRMEEKWMEYAKKNINIRMKERGMKIKNEHGFGKLIKYKTR